MRFSMSLRARSLDAIPLINETNLNLILFQFVSRRGKSLTQNCFCGLIMSMGVRCIVDVIKWRVCTNLWLFTRMSRKRSNASKSILHNAKVAQQKSSLETIFIIILLWYSFAELKWISPDSSAAFKNKLSQIVAHQSRRSDSARCVESTRETRRKKVRRCEARIRFVKANSINQKRPRTARRRRVEEDSQSTNTRDTKLLRCAKFLSTWLEWRGADDRCALLIESTFSRVNVTLCGRLGDAASALFVFVVGD